MAQAMAKYSKSPVPKSSMLKKTDAMGQLTAPQNTATNPIAAPKPAGRPKKPPNRHPKQAPTKKEGTTSPPCSPSSITPDGRKRR